MMPQDDDGRRGFGSAEGWGKDMKLEKCCGRDPYYECQGIGGDEYDHIKCEDCQEEILMRRDRAPSGEFIWNLTRTKQDYRTMQDEPFLNHPAL